MATYAIGDVQGCFVELQQLLAHIAFDPQQDNLWFTGDLVNRGPQSLEVLRFIQSLGDSQKTVLGNHDLHLLAIVYGVRKLQAKDTIQAVLDAPDRDVLIHWLCHRPLLYHDRQLGYVMTHAGLSPLWNLQKACALAQEVETVLRGETPEFFLEHMFGNQPDRWDEHLSGMERLRCITNYLTRMRFCSADGRLNLTFKGQVSDCPDDLVPWFDVAGRDHAQHKIIFGHWAALSGKVDVPHIYPLDTGCVWGNCLTAMRLEDEKQFSVPC